MAEEALNQEQEQQLWMEQPCQQWQANAGAAEATGEDDATGEDAGEEAPSFALPSIMTEVEADQGDDDEQDSSGDEQEGDEPAENDDAGGDEQQQQDDEQEGDEIATVSDLLKAQGWDQEWFDNLKVPIKVNGKPAEATLQDLMSSYQTQEAATERLTEAKSKAQQLHQEAERAKETSTTELATAQALTRVLEESVFTQEAEQLKKIRDEHGAGSDEYHDARDSLAAKLQAFRQAKQQISTKLTDALSERDKEPTQEDYAEYQAKLFERVPELKDEQTRQDLVGYALDFGFTQEHLEQETNPLLFALGYKAMLYDRAQAKAKNVEEQVHKIPRMMKPGAQRPAKQKPKDHAEVLYGSK